ncbi:MAG TPA: MFS transporter [Thermoplasmata archaeon]|nr:MFS transporter [Thermoplasmata archaeon]
MAVPPDPRSLEVHRRSLGAVFEATFFVRFAFGITLAVFATYLAGHETGGLTAGDTALVGLVTAMASVGEFSTVLVSGIVADRVGRFPVLFGGMIGAAVLFALVALTRNALALGAINFLFGISSGAILAATLAVVADRSGTDERGLEMGRFDAMNLAGWLGGYAFGIAILGWLPVAALGVTFIVGAAVLVAGTVVAVRLVRGLPRGPTATGLAPAEILRRAFRRNVLLVTLPWLVIYMLIGYVLVFFGSAAKSTGFPLIYVALAIAGGGALLVLSQPQFGRLADRYGRTRLMTVGVTGFVGVMIFASLLLAYGENYGLIAGLAASGLAALAYGPAALAALADLANVLSRATTMAIYSLTISLGMILGLVGATQLQERLGNEGLYLFFGAVAVALVALTLARLREIGRVSGPPVTIPAR